jgi:DNA polymerase-1
MRRVAKTVNFGIMYGLGAFGLSQRLKIGRNEAQGIITNYFEKYPGIRKYIDSTIKFAEENGYAETICGRKRYFNNINSKNRNLKTSDERAAINLPIQGTASDMMKIAMIRVDKKMREHNMKSLMMLQVHDELVFEARLDEIDKLKLLVKEEMEASLNLGDVPVVVEVGIGNNWFTAH